jgi:hypothetical protein
MSLTTAPMLELLSWLSARPRSYREAIEAWRSNCPRLSVWDDACGDGLIAIVRGGAQDDARVALTARGLALLAEQGRA